MYHSMFLNSAPAGTILFSFILYINPSAVQLGTTILLIITSNPSTAVASDIFGFASHNFYVYTHRILNASDYTVMDHVFYKAQSAAVALFTFHLQSVVPPFFIVGANNVDVTIIGESISFHVH